MDTDVSTKRPLNVICHRFIIELSFISDMFLILLTKFQSLSTYKLYCRTDSISKSLIISEKEIVEPGSNFISVNCLHIYKFFFKKLFINQRMHLIFISYKFKKQFEVNSNDLRW